MSQRVYYTKPSITEQEVAYATDAARNGWGERCYEYIAKFESLFREYTGAEFAIATSSCTGALHMGFAALDIGQGDEVILADTNWIASVAPITYLGAKPVFVDILPDTWCLDPDRVEAAITPRTKAILAVHLYGNLCEMDRLLAIGERYGIPVIEDSAEAVGSFWHGNHAGTMGLFGTFSFHGTKTLTTGEGGMFITSDRALYEKVTTLSNHGRMATQTKQFWADLIGFKYKMSNIQAAIGCAQMERIEYLVQRKREIFSYYAKCLAGLDGVAMNPEKQDTVNGYWMPSIVFSVDSGVTRDGLIKEFQAQQIDGRVFFYPLSGLDMFESCPENINSYDFPSRSINLPTYHDMTKNDQDRVIAVVKKVLDRSRSL